MYLFATYKAYCMSQAQQVICMSDTFLNVMLKGKSPLTREIHVMFKFGSFAKTNSEGSTFTASTSILFINQEFSNCYRQVKSSRWQPLIGSRHGGIGYFTDYSICVTIIDEIPIIVILILVFTLRTF